MAAKRQQRAPRRGRADGTPVETGQGDDVGAFSLAESAARQISEMIRSGELREGQKLPPERELAVTLRLSRGALREALSTLEAVGLLKARVGSGRYVAISGADDFGNGVSTWMHMQPVSDVIAVRRILEPAAIQAIPAMRVQATADECAEILARMSAAFSKGAHENATRVGSSRVDLQACKLEYSIVSPK